MERIHKYSHANSPPIHVKRLEITLNSLSPQSEFLSAGDRVPKGSEALIIFDMLRIFLNVYCIRAEGIELGECRIW
jgi:hypothetical protein